MTDPWVDGAIATANAGYPILQRCRCCGRSFEVLTMTLVEDDGQAVWCCGRADCGREGRCPDAVSRVCLGGA